MSQVFPSTGQIVAYYNVFLVSGPAAIITGICVCLYNLRKRPHAASSSQNGTKRVGLFVAGLMAIAIGAVHCALIYASVRHALRWQVDLSRISEIRVEAFAKGSARKPAFSRPLTVADARLLKEGFAELSTATAFHRSHEVFTEGYRIRLKLRDSETFSERFLSLYTDSDKRADVCVVIPYFGNDDSNATTSAGEYRCKRFHSWFFAEIVPHFGNSTEDDGNVTDDGME